MDESIKDLLGELLDCFDWSAGEEELPSLEVWSRGTYKLGFVPENLRDVLLEIKEKLDECEE